MLHKYLLKKRSQGSCGRLGTQQSRIPGAEDEVQKQSASKPQRGRTVRDKAGTPAQVGGRGPRCPAGGGSVGTCPAGVGVAGDGSPLASWPGCRGCSREHSPKQSEPGRGSGGAGPRGGESVNEDLRELPPSLRLCAFCFLSQ